MVTAKPKLIDHMLEIRRRLAYVVLTLLAGACVAYFIRIEIIDALLRPLEHQQLIYTSPIGGFEFLIKICLFFGTLITVPVMVYHVLRFLEPAVKKQTTRFLATLVAASSLLAAGGATFAYFLSLPAALHFLANFNTDNIQALLSTNEYLTFVMIYIAGFALLFQIPLILLVINKMKPLSPRKLLSRSRIVILLSFIVAAIITPTPDPINQSLMALPIIILYYAGTVLVWATNSRRKNVWYKDPVAWHGKKPRIDLAATAGVDEIEPTEKPPEVERPPAPVMGQLVHPVAQNTTPVASEPEATPSPETGLALKPELGPEPEPEPELKPDHPAQEVEEKEHRSNLYHPTEEQPQISKFHKEPQPRRKHQSGNSHLFHRPPLHMGEKAQQIISPHLLDLSGESEGA